MRLAMINAEHFMITQDAAFVNLSANQVKSIWMNLHLDYPDLFLFLGEHVLESQKARKSLQVMVDAAGSVREAMAQVEEDVVRLARELKFKKTGVVRTPAHATAKPAPVEDSAEIRMRRATPLLPSLPIEEIPTAPVFRWEPRPAARGEVELEPALVD